MSIANPLWGAPRIHGELFKLGTAVGQTTVAKYMAKRRRPPSQGWKLKFAANASGNSSRVSAGSGSDSLNEPVGTNSIGVLPRPQTFKGGAGRQNVGVGVAPADDLHADRQVTG